MCSEGNYLWLQLQNGAVRRMNFYYRDRFCGSVSGKELVTDTDSSLNSNELPSQIHTSGSKQINSESFWLQRYTKMPTQMFTGAAFLCVEFGNRPNMVSEGTVSNTELSEFFWPSPRELSEFFLAHYLWVKTNSPVLCKTHRVCRQTQWVLFRKVSLETAFSIKVGVHMP